MRLGNPLSPAFSPHHHTPLAQKHAHLSAEQTNQLCCKNHALDNSTSTAGRHSALILQNPKLQRIACRELHEIRTRHALARRWPVAQKKRAHFTILSRPGGHKEGQIFALFPLSSLPISSGRCKLHAIVRVVRFRVQRCAHCPSPITGPDLTPKRELRAPIVSDCKRSAFACVSRSLARVVRSFLRTLASVFLTHLALLELSLGPQSTRKHSYTSHGHLKWALDAVVFAKFLPMYDRFFFQISTTHTQNRLHG